jgi:hypothetical protein
MLRLAAFSETPTIQTQPSSAIVFDDMHFFVSLSLGLLVNGKWGGLCLPMPML